MSLLHTLFALLLAGGSWRPAPGLEGGRYAPLRSAASHERFRADLTRMISLNLEGKPGLVIAVEFERMQDQLAFNAIAHQKKGDFIFQPGERPAERRIQSPVHLMLLEAARIADESRK